MKEFEHLALRGVGWAGKRALFGLGLVAMAALVVVMGVLTAVVLTATVLPTTAARRKGTHRGKRGGTNASKFSAPREKAVVENPVS